MNIDWTHFTPWTALAGGILLGIASAAFILVNGRVLGISGILGGLLVPKRSDASWRVFFLLGMLLAPATLSLLAPGLISAPRIEAGTVAIVVAVMLTLRRREGTKHQDPAQQVAIKRKDRVRLVSMPAEKAAGAASADSNG